MQTEQVLCGAQRICVARAGKKSTVCSSLNLLYNICCVFCQNLNNKESLKHGLLITRVIKYQTNPSYSMCSHLCHNTAGSTLAARSEGRCYGTKTITESAAAQRLIRQLLREHKVLNQPRPHCLGVCVCVGQLGSNSSPRAPDGSA